MSAYDTSPSGHAAQARKDEMVIREAKAGSPKGTSGAYSNPGNTASPSEATVSRNNINKPAMPKPPGSTSDTGRAKP